MARRKAEATAATAGGGASEMVGGGEDVGLMSLRGLIDATTSAMNPLTVARESARLYGEWLKIMLDKSAREVPRKDWRFADPAWREHPIYKRIAQGYLAFCDAIDKVVDDNPDWRKRERARFLTGILTSAMAPTNTLIGNPAALKKAYETGGRSLVARRAEPDPRRAIQQGHALAGQAIRLQGRREPRGDSGCRRAAHRALRAPANAADDGKGARDSHAHHSAAHRQVLFQVRQRNLWVDWVRN